MYGLDNHYVWFYVTDSVSGVRSEKHFWTSDLSYLFEAGDTLYNLSLFLTKFLSCMTLFSFALSGIVCHVVYKGKWGPTSRSAQELPSDTFLRCQKCVVSNRLTFFFSLRLPKAAKTVPWRQVGPVMVLSKCFSVMYLPPITTDMSTDSV